MEELRRGRRKERESCKIFAKKNNPGTLSNYIYLSCVVLLGRPCGLPACSMVHFSHYLILDGEQREEEGWVRELDGGCVGAALGGWGVVVRWGGRLLGGKCGKDLWVFFCVYL